MKKKIILAAAAAAMMTVSAMACTCDVGRANTDCYVRSLKDGSIAGSLAKGDLVVVEGRKSGWVKIDIGGKDYKVWGEYLEVKEDICLDEVSVIGKVRKSRSAGQTVRNKKECSIKGSAFEDIYPW